MSDEAMVRCTECRHEWFGVAAAEAMTALGHCILCHGRVEFPRGSPSLVPEDDPLAGLTAAMKPHQVLGPPRI